MTYGALPIDQSGGVHGTFNFGRFAIGGTYIEGGISTPIGTPGAVFDNAPYVFRPNPDNGGRDMWPKRAQIYGGDLRFPIMGNLSFAGEFASSNVLAGVKLSDRQGVYPTKDRNAYDAKLAWTAGRLSLAGGYKRVDPFFGAPGSWGAIGRWKNPTNIKGWDVSGGYNFGGFTLKGGYEDFKSVKVDTSLARAGSGIQTPFVNYTSAFEDKIQHFTAGVSYNLSPVNSVDLGYEQARIRPFDTINKTRETYVTLGLGHTFNENTLVKVLYQIVDYKDNGAGLYTIPGGAYKGGIGVTQLSVRF
jgi:predicted porin